MKQPIDLMQNNFYTSKDLQGDTSLMAIWNHTCESAYGLAASSHRVALASCGLSLV